MCIGSVIIILKKFYKLIWLFIFVCKYGWVVVKSGCFYVFEVKCMNDVIGELFSDCKYGDGSGVLGDGVYWDWIGDLYEY